MTQYLSVNVIKIQQSIGGFFLGKLTPDILHLISNKKLSRIQNPDMGIQRDLKNSKIKEIKEYLKTKDSTFPNTIIIAIQNDPMEMDPSYILEEEENIIQIKLQDGIANILDGQHRLNGFDSNEKTFEIPVAIFLDLSLGEQAKIFAKINSTQSKVDLSLVYDLFGITKERTPEKVAFHLVEHLNQDDSSAWKGKVKTLTDKRGDLAQGSMAKLFHKELLEKNALFKKLYDEKRDTDIKNILVNYFNAIAKTFPDEWKNEKKEYILTKTTGFNGFVLFLLQLIKIANHSKIPLSAEYFAGYMEKAKDDLLPFTSENYPSGATGQNKIKTILLKSVTQSELEIIEK